MVAGLDTPLPIKADAPLTTLESALGTPTPPPPLQGTSTGLAAAWVTTCLALHFTPLLAPLLALRLVLRLLRQ